MKIKIELSEGVKVFFVMLGVFVVIFLSFFLLGWLFDSPRGGAIVGSIMVVFYLIRLLVGLVG